MKVAPKVGQELEPNLLTTAQSLMRSLLADFEPERAIVLVSGEDLWSAAATHNLPAEEFWKQEHLSIGAVAEVASEGESKLGADSAMGYELLSMLSGTLYAFLAVPAEVEGRACVVYLSRPFEQGLYNQEDLARLEQFLRVTM